jgi:hypothetical protein
MIPGVDHYDKTHAPRTACGQIKHRKLRSNVWSSDLLRRAT